MADSKITALTALTAADPVNDMFPVVDVSDTSMAASGTTKRISVNNILSSSPTASGALTVTGLVTAGSATITGAATVGTTLGVTGASTLASVGVTGAATVGTTLLVGTNATLTNGNVIIGTSGKGIDFSATANGSGTMTSELLADYEEGTWTGTLTGGTTTPGSPVAATGRYTKIGRVVNVQIEFSNENTVGYLGNIGVTGLPFQNGPKAFTGAVGLYQIATFTGSPFMLLDASTSSLQFLASVSNATYSNVTHNAGIARYLTASITYTVA
jgi:hypothetical protein